MTLKQFTRDLSPSVKSYSLSTGESIRSGLVVMPYGMGKAYRNTTKRDAVLKFVSQFGVELEQPNRYIVGFHADGITKLAVAERFDSVRDGVVYGIQQLNDTVYDMTSDRQYRLPSPDPSCGVLDDMMIMRVNKTIKTIKMRRAIKELWFPAVMAIVVGTVLWMVLNNIYA